jgi:hypothetical protein
MIVVCTDPIVTSLRERRKGGGEEHKQYGRGERVGEEPNLITIRKPWNRTNTPPPLYATCMLVTYRVLQAHHHRGLKNALQDYHRNNFCEVKLFYQGSRGSSGSSGSWTQTCACSLTTHAIVDAEVELSEVRLCVTECSTLRALVSYTVKTQVRTAHMLLIQVFV